MNSRLYEMLRPGEIVRLAQARGLVLIPVSPMVEWHSWHLPLGTDGIIAEAVARALAEQLDGVYFRTLPLATDQVRPVEFKTQIGLPPDVPVFGMNFPGLPVASEYHEPADLIRLVGIRLEAVKASGFRTACLVNHHGGEGQFATLQTLAAQHSRPGFQVLALQTHRFNTFKPPEALRHHFQVGGHAGLAETTQLMAFHPELVDLTQLPEGTLTVPEMGILHNVPVIPEKFNPRLALLSLAQEWRNSVLDNMAAAIRAAMNPTDPLSRVL